MHFRQPVRELVGTIDSIELVNRARMIRKMLSNDRPQGIAKVGQEQKEDGKGEGREDKEGANAIPKEGRFNLSKGAGVEQDEKEKACKDKIGEEEIEIEFSSEYQLPDDLSALSRSTRKQWEENESMIVWETNE